MGDFYWSLVKHKSSLYRRRKKSDFLSRIEKGSRFFLVRHHVAIHFSRDPAATFQVLFFADDWRRYWWWGRQHSGQLRWWRLSGQWTAGQSWLLSFRLLQEQAKESLPSFSIAESIKETLKGLSGWSEIVISTSSPSINIIGGCISSIQIFLLLLLHEAMLRVQMVLPAHKALLWFKISISSLNPACI